MTCSNDFSLKLWCAETLEEKRMFIGHQSAVTSVAYKVKGRVHREVAREIANRSGRDGISGVEL